MVLSEKSTSFYYRIRLRDLVNFKEELLFPFSGTLILFHSALNELVF